MINFIRRPVVGIIILVFMVLCIYVSIISAPPPVVPIPPTETHTPIPPTSTPAPPPFKGRLIVGSSEGVFALISDPATGKIKEKQFATVASYEEGAISPDNRFLLFTNDPLGTTLIDLSTFEAITSFPEIMYCPQWAADSKRFSYISLGGLHIHNINTGNSELIWQAPSADYYGIGGGTRYGRIECGFWIDSDRLLFERFLGPMPSQISGDAHEIAANTTTLAILGDSLELIDSPEQLHVLAVSKEGDYVLLEENGTMYAANSFSDFADIYLHSLAPLPILQDRFGTFLPNSNQILAENDERIYIINPETLDIEGTFAIPFGKYSFVIGYKKVQTTFMGDPNEGAYISINFPHHIEIGDLNTGTKAELWDATKYDHLEWLAWIP